MSCRVAYIENAINSSPIAQAEKDRTIQLATNAHRAIVEEVINDSSTYFLTTNGVRKLFVKQADNIPYKALLQARGWFDPNDVNNSVIAFVDEGDKQHLSFNVFANPNILELQRLGLLTNTQQITATPDAEVLEELFVLPSIVNIQSHLEGLVSPQSEEVFKGFLKDVRNKLKLYENSLSNVSDNYQVAMSQKEIQALRFALEREDTQALVEGTDKYVRTAVNKLNYLSALFFGATEEYKRNQNIRLAKLENSLQNELNKPFPNLNQINYYKREINKTKNALTNTIGIKGRIAAIERKRDEIKNNIGDVAQKQIDIEYELKDLNDLLQQGRYYYHLFDNLEALHSEVVALDGVEKEIDRFDKRQLSDSLIVFVDRFNNNNNTTLDANEIADNAFDATGMVDIPNLKAYLGASGVTNVNDFLQNFTESVIDRNKTRPSFLYSLKTSLTQASVFKAQMNNLYVDVFTTTFFPEYQQHFDEFRKKAAKDGELQYLDDKYLLDEAKFKALVKVALKDADVISHYMRETIGIDDQLTQYMTLYIKNLFNEHTRNSATLNAKIDKLRRDTGVDEMDDAAKTQMFDDMVFKTKKVALNKYGKIQHIITLTDAEKLGLTKQEQDALIQQKATELEEPEKGVTYIPINMFNEIYYVQALDEEDLIKDYDDFQYRNEKLVFQQLLDRKMKEIFAKLPVLELINGEQLDLENAFQALNDLATEYNIPLTDKLVYQNTNQQGVVYYGTSTAMKSIFKNNGTTKSIAFEDLKDLVQDALFAGFFSQRIKPKTFADQIDVLRTNKIVKTSQATATLVFNLDSLQNSREVQKNLAAISSKKDNVRSKTSKYTKLTSAVSFSMDTVLGIERTENGEEFKDVLVQVFDDATSSYQYETRTYKKNILDEWVYDGSIADLENVVSFYKVKGELSDFHANYKAGSANAFKYDVDFNRKFNQTRTPNQTRIFNTLKDIKKDISLKMGSDRGRGLYNIVKGDIETLEDSIKAIPQRALATAKGVFDIGYKEDTEPKARWNPNTKQMEYLDAQNNVVPIEQAARVDKKKYNVDGTSVDELGMDYTDYVTPKERERDLLYSFAKMQQNVNNHHLRTTNLSKINTIRTLYKGDIKAGISPRKANKISPSGEKSLDRDTDDKLLIDASHLTKNMEAFIQDAFYGMTRKEYAISFGNVKIDMHKLADKITGLSAIQALALNFAAMPANHFISTIGNYSEAAMGRHFNKQIFRETYRELFLDKKAKIDYLKDYRSNKMIDKSMLAQAAILFDAVQGEMMDMHGVVHKESLARKLANDVWFSTSNAVEYTNQLLTMVSLMKGFTQKDANGDVVYKTDANGNQIASTLYNSIIHQDGELIQFEPWVTEKVKNEFTNLVQTISRQLHGNYKNADKNLLNRTWFGRLALLFKRWIYNTVQARFQGEQLDWEQYSIEEGYFRTYLSKLTSEYKDVFEKNGMKGFVDPKVAPTYFKAIAKTGIKTITETLRSGLLLNKIGDKNTWSEYEKWMYGATPSERQKRAIERTSAELALILQIMILGFVFHIAAEGADDDKEDIDYITLRWLEFYAFKMQAEMQFYTPFLYLGQGLPAGYTIDTAQRFLKDPLTMTRMIDVNLGLIRDLVGFSMFNEDGEMEFDWKANDIYDRSGKGYEKGEYKITKKLERSVFAPYYQYIRLFNPDQQLSYMDLIFKNN